MRSSVEGLNQEIEKLVLIPGQQHCCRPESNLVILKQKIHFSLLQMVNFLSFILNEKCSFHAEYLRDIVHRWLIFYNVTQDPLIPRHRLGTIYLQVR